VTRKQLELSFETMMAHRGAVQIFLQRRFVTNNNHSDDNHAWPGVDSIVDAYIAKQQFNNDISDVEGDVILAQSQWSTQQGLDTLWDTVGIEQPDQNWIHQYLEDYTNHQNINKELAEELTNAYNLRRK
jgi:hypothetical protein